MNLTLAFMKACYAEYRCDRRQVWSHWWGMSMKAIRRYFNGIHKMIYPLVVLFFLVVADGGLTNVLVNGGETREGKTFMVPLVGSGDFLVLKLVGALFCAFILWDIYRQRPKVAVISTSCLLVAYGGIVFWNLALLLTSQV